MNVLLLANRSLEQFEAICRTEDLTHSQYVALWTLCLADDADVGIPVSAVSDGLLNRASDTTRLLDRLEKAGLVERLPNPADRRGVLVRATPAGRKRFEAVTPKLQAVPRNPMGEPHPRRGPRAPPAARQGTLGKRRRTCESLSSGHRSLVRLGRRHDGLELAGSGVEVSSHQLDGPVGVAGQRGLADLAMLVSSVAYGRYGPAASPTSTGRARTRRTTGGGSARGWGCRPRRTARRGRRRARPSSPGSACRPRSGWVCRRADGGPRRRRPPSSTSPAAIDSRRASVSIWMRTQVRSRMSASERDRTRNPRCGMASTRSSDANRVTASRTTLRLTLCSSAKSRSGIRDPGSRRPKRMSARNAS